MTRTRTARGARTAGGSLRRGVVAAGLILVALGFGSALAQAPSSTLVEQHQELLGRTLTATGATVEPLERGVLASGTSKFEPAPTATLHVAGRVTAAVGGGGWRVRLRDSAGATLAEVSFGSADTNLTIKTASITWPAADRSLEDLQLTTVAPNLGDLPGILELRKAYVKLRQSGVLKKTVGRVPVSRYQSSITWTDYANVSDVAFYKHVSADFDPSPTVKLRVGAEMLSGSSGSLQLIDAQGSVAGSVAIGASRASHESSALSLVSGRVYRVEAKVANAGDEMRVYGADLVFEQSTTDSLGLYKTVGWYPSVTAGADIEATNPDIGFPFKAPGKSVYGVEQRWIGTVKGGGSQDPQVKLVDRTAGNSVRATITTASSVFTYLESLVQATNSPEGNTLDTTTSLLPGGAQASSSSEPATPRVTMTMLRIALNVRDTGAPTIGTLTGLPAIFSPNTPPDGWFDTTTFSATVSDPSPTTTYQLVIKDSSNVVVRTINGSIASTGTTVSEPWDGLNDTTGQKVSDGSYMATLTATDSWGNSSTSNPVTVIADLIAPTASITSPSSGLISGQTTITATATDNHSGVESVEFHYRRGFSDGTKGPWHLIATDTTAPYSTVIRTVGLADGPIEVALRATDGVKNKSDHIGILSFEVRNGELLGHHGFYSERGWQAGDGLRLGVNPYWGNLTADFFGGAVHAAGPPQAVTLHYNSRNPSRDVLGWGWSFGMLDRLEFPADGSVIVREGSGRRYRFAHSGGTYTRPAGVYMSLVHNGNGTWDLTDKAGVKRSFDAAGRQTSMADRNGRTRTYTWVAGKLTSISHPSGQATAIAYDASNRIWTITEAGRVTTLTYNAANQLTKITNADNKDYVFGYDADHRMTLAKDPLLNQYTPSYVSSGLWDWVGSVGGFSSATFGYGSQGAEFSRTVTNARGHTTSYVFNALGGATQVTEPSAPAKQYQRDADQNVTQFTDELGNAWRATFDANGNVTSRQSPLEFAAGKSRTYTYNLLNKLLTFSDSLTPSNIWTYTYDASGNLATEKSPVDSARGKVTTYGYDTAGNLTSITDQLGKVWTNTYDSAGRRLTAASPEDTLRGKSVTYAYDTRGNLTGVTNQLAKTWVFTYDTLGRRLTDRDPLLQTTTNVFDANGNVLIVRDALNKETVHTYNAAGQVLTTKTPLQTSSNRTTYSYDAVGNLASMRDPDVATPRSYGYDSRNRRTTSTTARGKTTTTTYDAAGRITSVANHLGETTRHCYDAAGRQTKTIDPRGTGTCATATSYVTQTAYDLMGHPLTITDAEGNVARSCYDADGRVISQTDPRASVSCGTTSSYTTTSTYDDAGRLATRTVPGRAPLTYGYDAAGRVKTTNDGTGTVTYGYDDTGRVAELIDADGNKASYGYDDAGRLIGYVDPRGNATGAIPSDYESVYTHDANGRLIAITNQLDYTRSMAYNDDGHLIAVTDPRGNVAVPNDPAFTTTVTRYPSGRLESITDPDDRVVSYEYDADGNMTAIEDGLGGASFTWNGAQRLSNATFSIDGPTGSSYTLSRTYDPVGNRATMTDPTGTTSYEFNSLSLPVTVFGPANQVVYEDDGGLFCEYPSPCGYDAAGNIEISKLLDPDITLGHDFDAANRQTSISSSWAAATFSYDARGLPDTYVDAAGYTEDLTLSPAGFPQRLVLKRTATGTIDADLVITPDKGHRPTAITNNGTTEHTYTYDRVGAISAEQYRLSGSLQTVNYTYDRAGNRKTRQVVGDPATQEYEYSKSGALTSISTAGVPTSSLSYDANGNLTSFAAGANTVTYTWGPNKRLVQATKLGGTPIKFTYDGNGLVTKREVGPTLYPYRYDANRLEAIREVGLNGTVDKIQFTYAADGTPIAMRAPGGDVFYYHYDAFGSVDRLTKGTQLAVRYVYDSFGNIVETTQGPAFASLLNDNPFRFMGRYQVKYDPQLNLYELDGRFYDPAIGRYLSRDAALSYLPCWPGTCVAVTTTLGNAGLPAPDTSLGGYCGVGLDMTVEPEDYVTFHARAECSGPGEGRHAHIVNDDMRICKTTCDAVENLPRDQYLQCCRVYDFGGGDALSGHDGHADPLAPTHPAHALLLHDFSCDGEFECWAPNKEQAWGIPCGGTKREDVPGLPGGWTDAFDKRDYIKKDCGGADWIGESEVHFFGPYYAKKPWDNGDLFGEPLWLYQYETGPLQGETCGGHEYDFANERIPPNPEHGIGNVAVARDLAAYHTGQGVWCYQNIGSANRE